MPELYRYKNLASYLLAKVQKTSLYSIAGTAIKYTRRFMLLTRIVSYIRIAVTVIEASAVLILLAAVIITLTPITALLFVGFIIADGINSRRILKSRALLDMLSRERIYIFCGAGGFGRGLAEELADTSAVFIVTASPKERFVTAKINGGVCYIRHSFFFRLKRARLAALADKTVYLM